MAIAASFANLRPSLLLDFANVGALDPRITFTRSTTGTYYDGVTTAKAEENLILYSQAFDNARWSKSNVTVDSTTESAPDSTSTAARIAETTANAGHSVTSTNSPSGMGFTSGLPYVASVFFKKGPGATAPDWMRVYFIDYVALPCYVNFDIGTGAVGVQSNAVGSITSVGGSWYRCTVAFTATSTGSFARAGFGFIDNTDSSSSTTSYTGATTSDVLVWGFQVEQRSSVTAYTPTTTQPITNYIPVLQTAAAGQARFDHNPTTGEALGLLIEEQRANGLTWSESFRTQTLAVTGVSGTFADGETVTATGGGTGTYVLAESTGSSFAIFNGSGTFTGTLTGGTSGATATISSSVAAWLTTRSSITANTIVAPDGTLTGDKLVEDTTASDTHVISQAYAFTGPQTQTYSVYVKKGERNWCALRMGTAAFGGDKLAYFDLANGTKGSVTAGTTSDIISVGNGWYRCTITATSVSGPLTAGYAVLTATADNTSSYTGDGYSGIYVWGAQLE